MDLKNLIRPQLWNEISNTYLAENYRTSILDAMRYLSQVIREKSGLDGDGTSLVGQAFGGEEPKLKLNKLQTQSEKDEQKGLQLIISGLYSAIRNPRTHEGIQDSKNTADPIIYFINYILNIIEVAKPPFAIEDFLPRIFDEGFVRKELYVKELVKEIPRNKYLETLIEIYRKKYTGNALSLQYVFKEIMSQLTENEIQELMDVVSAELDVINVDGKIVMILQIIPSQYWPLVKTTAKMRIENKLILSISYGKWSPDKRLTEGALGAWALKIIDQFTLKKELSEIIAYNLNEIKSYEYNRYILYYFLKYLPKLFENPQKYNYFVKGMRNVVQYNDILIKDKLIDFLVDCPEHWQKGILNGFKDWTDEEHPEVYMPDGTPFLGKVPYQSLDKRTDAETEDFPF